MYTVIHSHVKPTQTDFMLANEWLHQSSWELSASLKGTCVVVLKGGAGVSNSVSPPKYSWLVRQTGNQPAPIPLIIASETPQCIGQVVSLIIVVLIGLPKYSHTIHMFRKYVFVT